jgi:hypothetical protein
MFIKDKQMLVFNLLFIFNILLTDRGSLASSVVLGFRELKLIEKHGSRVPKRKAKTLVYTK